MRGFAGREAIDRVGLAGAREALGSIPPCQQPSRYDAEYQARCEQSEHEVVVFGPTAIPVGVSAQNFAADHQGGMGDRALDECLCADSLWRIDRVEPVLVGAHAVSEIASGEKPNVTPDRGQSGIALERGTLSGKSVAVHPVIGVHARHETPPTMLEAIDQGRNEASMGSTEQPESRICRRKRPGNIDTAIARSIVDDDTLPIGVGLTLDAAQAGGQRFNRVEYG
jgi:hypothetical protein